MPGSWPPHELPNLAEHNCEITSPESRRYNCIAWSAGNDSRWWWPDPMGIGYWPANARREVSTQAFLEAYRRLGYTLYFDGAHEEGIEKIALYGKGPVGSETPTHAALQLENGTWSSKLGPFEDITHKTPGDVEGASYGHLICYLGRPRQK